MSVIQYIGVFHAMKDSVKERWSAWWEKNFYQTNSFADERESNFRTRVRERLERLKDKAVSRIDRASSQDEAQDFSHLTRPKTTGELLQISAAVMGIEFSYAAETAFVSPLLLQIGLRHGHMTLMWCLSPLIGLFLTPLLGSWSDGCRSRFGRRRPFIVALSIGVVLGLLLVPNGVLLGKYLGDSNNDTISNPRQEGNNNYSHSNVQYPTTTKRRGSGGGANYFHAEQENSQSSSSEKMPEESAYFNSKRSRFFSKYDPRMHDQGFRARNSLRQEDNDGGGVDILKGLKRKWGLDAKAVLGSRDNNSSTQEDPLAVFIKNFQSNKNMHMRLGSGQDETSEETKDGSSGLHNVEKRAIGGAVVVVGEEGSDGASKGSDGDEGNGIRRHPWALVLTVVGVALLDFDADACQSPARAYMLDVTLPEDHARGLSSFTVMAGLGGSLGYALGALNWDETRIGEFFGGQVRAVFTLVLFIFIVCVCVTLRSFREIPLNRLIVGESHVDRSCSPSYSRFEDTSRPANKTYGTTNSDTANDHITSAVVTQVEETSFSQNGASSINATKDAVVISAEKEPPAFKEYVRSIFSLPTSLKWLCLTNFFCWMSLVCYSLYFTDYVGEAVFGGDPTAREGSKSKIKYNEGVRFGCWGMSVYSLSCSLYSACIESVVNRFGAKRVYITGQLVYSVGMILMGLACHPIGVIVFSWTAGIMYATLFTMPYLLVARYHAAETFDLEIDDLVATPPHQTRGLGTDVAIVSSMVFLAQITQAVILGHVVTVVGSTTAIIFAASIFAACGALAATKVLYLDL